MGEKPLVHMSEPQYHSIRQKEKTGAFLPETLTNGSLAWLFILCTMVLMLFIVVGRYAIPSADDFCMATGVHYRGLGSFLWQHYQEWSGRYTGNALYAVYPLVFDLFSGYRFFPALLLLLQLSACAFVLAELFRKRMNDPLIVTASLVFLIVYLSGMTSTASSLYWMAGALTYQTGNLLLLFTIGWIVRLSRRLRDQQPVGSVVVILSFLIVAGMGVNEIYMLTLTGIMLAALFFNLGRYSNNYKVWVWLILLTFLCASIVYFAPGNRLREATFPLRHDLVRTLHGSLDMGLWTLITWLKNPLLILASLLTPLLIHFLQHQSASYRVSRYGLLMSVCVTLATPFVLQIPAWWSMGGWPPQRTVDAIYFVFLCGWFLSVGLLSLRYLPSSRNQIDSSLNPHKAKTTSPLLMSILLVLVILFSGAILNNKNVKRAWHDLTTNGPLFEAYIQKRYRLISAARASGHSVLVVPNFNQEYPRSVYFNDILPNAADWRNRCYAAYFGLSSIRREKRIRPEQPVNGIHDVPASEVVR